MHCGLYTELQSARLDRLEVGGIPRDPEWVIDRQQNGACPDVEHPRPCGQRGDEDERRREATVVTDTVLATQPTLNPSASAAPNTRSAST